MMLQEHLFEQCFLYTDVQMKRGATNKRQLHPFLIYMAVLHWQIIDKF